MLVSIIYKHINKDYPALYFEEKSVTKYALVAKKISVKCEICPTSPNNIVLQATILLRQ